MMRINRYKPLPSPQIHNPYISRNQNEKVLRGTTKFDSLYLFQARCTIILIAAGLVEGLHADVEAEGSCLCSRSKWRVWNEGSWKLGKLGACTKHLLRICTYLEASYADKPSQSFLLVKAKSKLLSDFPVMTCRLWAPPPYLLAYLPEEEFAGPDDRNNHQWQRQTNVT